MKQSRATGKIMLAIDRLAADLPLYGGILGRWKLQENPNVKTMAVGFQRGRLILYYAPAFVERTDLNSLVGVVEHECLHVVLGHVFHEPSPNDNPNSRRVASENANARTVSEEVTCNEWVSHKLPLSPILLSDYPMLPANEDTETRYERLKDIIPDVRVITIDDHATWAEIMANGQLASAVVKVVVAQAWDKLSPEQKSKITLPPQVREAVEKAVREAGSMVIDAGANSVPWQTILKKYVGRALMRRPMFGRVPRRFPELVGVIPATGRSKTKPHIVFCLDTSGSMTASVLCDISAELVCIAKSHQVTVIEADDAVRAVYKFRGPLTSVTGRRGTDFRLAFEEAAKLKPDLLIYGTDGFGKAPAPAPRFETIWLLTPSGRKPTSWGREVRMQG